MSLGTEFRVEQSSSGDTVMVTSHKAMTVLLRGRLVAQVERVAKGRGISVSQLLEEVIEERFGAMVEAGKARAVVPPQQPAVKPPEGGSGTGV
jgi:hypothetical protein